MTMNILWGAYTLFLMVFLAGTIFGGRWWDTPLYPRIERWVLGSTLVLFVVIMGEFILSSIMRAL